MTAESASDRQQQWALIVRRSFGIPDLVPNKDAREALIGHLEGQLQENGWQNPTRGICEPIVDALMALEVSRDLDDARLPAELLLSDATFSTRAAAYRLLDRGMTVVDPENLVFDVTSTSPSEIVEAVQQVLDRVGQYVREQPS